MSHSKQAFLVFLLVNLFITMSGQFGPIGYDFKDPYVEFEGLRFAVRLSTESNIYCPAPKDVILDNTRPGELTLYCNRLASAGGQLTSPGELELKISRLAENLYTLSARGSHPLETCLTLQVLVKGIEVESFVSEYPQAKGVHSFDGTGGFQFSYPSRAATMPLTFITTPTDEWFILSKDREIRRKGFGCYWDYLTHEPVVMISHDEDIRKVSNSIEAPSWKMGFGHARHDVVMERCDDLEKYFDLKPWSQRTSTSWIDGLKVVSFFHGVHWTGHLFNTFDQMGDQLEWICKTVDGGQVMAFLPAWDGRYYNTYPEHLPDERMGGAEGLNRFVSRAHAMGVKVV